MQLRRYRFFDIGNDHYYYDDYANETLMNRYARTCCLPAASMLLRKIAQHKGALKVSLYISGIALDLFGKYAPSVIETFQRLADSGCVEFIGGTWSHSLASLKCPQTFREQAEKHKKTILELMGQEVSTFYNAELIYSDELGSMLHGMGYNSAYAEGSRLLLGWRSPDMIYSNAIYPEFKLLMRNQPLSDEISFRFSDPSWEMYRTQPSGLVQRIGKTNPGEQLVNLLLDFGIMGAYYPSESGIFSFMERFLTGMSNSEYLEFSTPAEIIRKYPPASLVSVPNPMAWASGDQDINAWSGNELQQAALKSLYELQPLVSTCGAADIIQDWNCLQSSDHFYHMSSRFYTRDLPHRENPFHTPHEAFVNYMNILSDLKLRLEEARHA